MARRTQIRTKAVDGTTEVLVLNHHPMETGQRTDPKTKKKIPPHFVQKVIFSLNGNDVASADLGVAVSANPLIGVRIEGAKTGDTVRATWSDNKGENGSAETTVG
jgi:sulfur-oxidizing protein SoxZ